MEFVPQVNLTLVLTHQHCAAHAKHLPVFTDAISGIIYVLTKVEQCIVSQRKDEDSRILQAGMHSWEKGKHFGALACRIRSIIHKLCEVKSLLWFILVRNSLPHRKYTKQLFLLYVCTYTCVRVITVHTNHGRKMSLFVLQEALSD